jgi:hypothetical protein
MALKHLALAGAARRRHTGFAVVLWTAVTTLVAAAALIGGDSLAATCGGGSNLPLGTGDNLLVQNGECHVATAGTYNYGDVNIISGGSLIFDEVPNGNIHFWAKNILIENTGSLRAGAQPDLKDTRKKPYGSVGGHLTIHLYGKEDANPVKGAGVLCQTPTSDTVGPCGIPSSKDGKGAQDIWNSNKIDTNTPNPATCVKKEFRKNFTECFYQYTSLPYDGGAPQGFFGYKVLAMSFGGTLQLFGRRGAVYSDDNANAAKCDADPACTGTSWARLNTGNVVQPKDPQTLTLDRKVDWQTNDEIIVSTTDYVPSHSEVRKITKNDTTSGVSILTLDRKLDYPHNGKLYKFTDKNIPARLALPGDFTAAETRAAVGLLTRSIRIVSGGDEFNKPFPPPPGATTTPKYIDPPDPPYKQADFSDLQPQIAAQKGYYFGGHLIFRQGFQAVQLQGVELHHLGQGGKLGHYPVHFHLARQTPINTFIKDSSVYDSMTRWIVLHATHGVTLQRNVGYHSIGHGYYLEDGTEIDNKLYGNLGVSANAAVWNRQNPRLVPGILESNPAETDSTNRSKRPFFDPNPPFNSDFLAPTLFWIMNGWNDFEYNMAAGAEACGVGYWLLPGSNSGPSIYMNWSAFPYADEQRANGPGDVGRAGLSPLRKFVGNAVSTAQMAVNTVGATGTCLGVATPLNDKILIPIPNPYFKTAPPSSGYYANVTGFRDPSFCEAGKDCGSDNANTGVPRCSEAHRGNCPVTVLDRFTSAFNWPETNFAALWLRPQWFLVSNSAISDAQNGGLTFVTGGSYTTSDALTGLWQLARKSVFIGNTQSDTDNPYASNGGPFNPASFTLSNEKFKCDNKSTTINYCLSIDGGISLQRSNFQVNQRLFNIYDGPNFQDSNAYLDVKLRTLDDCSPDPNGRCTTCKTGIDCPSKWPQGTTTGVLRDPTKPKDSKGSCYLPNAAIAWKQPNGFYYPPAFDSRNLFFNNVDIRHFVIEPLFKEVTSKAEHAFTTDQGEIKLDYYTRTPDMFDNFTDIDRQTELTDLDGSLTGLLALPKVKATAPVAEAEVTNQGATISVNQDEFFDAPTETLECRSGEPTIAEGTAKTSPYEYVTTVLYPECARTAPILPDSATCATGDWTKACTNPACYGVPLYRLLLTPEEFNQNPRPRPVVKLQGQSLYQRSTLTVNNGKYFIDTTVDKATQEAANQYSVNRGDRPNSLNVFHAGDTYYVFPLWAKASTRQTYIIFVGKGDAQYQANIAKNVQAVQVNVGEAPLKDKPVDWQSTKWPTPSYNPDNGLLSVTIDMGFPDFATNNAAAREDQCQPQSFCAWDGGKSECSCKAGENFDLCKSTGTNDVDVCTWASREVQCPAGGCYGFAVRLSDKFTTSAQDVYPQDAATACFTAKRNPDFDVNFARATTVSGPECANTPAPGPQFCPSAP